MAFSPTTNGSCLPTQLQDFCTIYYSKSLILQTTDDICGSARRNGHVRHDKLGQVTARRSHKNPFGKTAGFERFSLCCLHFRSSQRTTAQGVWDSVRQSCGAPFNSCYRHVFPAGTRFEYSNLYLTLH